MKNKYYIACAVIMTIIMALLFSYAYFAATTDIANNLALSVSIEDGISANLTATGDDNLTVNVLGENMLNGTIGEVSGTGNTMIEVKLESSMDVVCTYDLYWTWAEDTLDEYIKTESDENEFTIMGTSDGGLISEMQVPNYGSELLLGSYSIASMGNNNIQNWNFIANFYNINAIQDAHENKTYKGRIEIRNAECGEVNGNTLSSVVLGLGNSSDYTSSQDSSIYRVTQEEVTYEGDTLNAGVRYEGLDPDNYLTFNGEEAGWRIIGVFEGSTIGLEPGKQYTKIIRNTRIGSYYWDSDGENDWTNSTLNTYLNGTYLSSMSDSDKIATYNGNYSTWYLRGTSNYTNLYSQEWYVTERYTGQAGYRGGTQYGADTETTGAIGIMYPSDYGYAAYGSSCDNNSSMTLYNYEGGCAAVDWLATDSINNVDWEWLISPRTDFSDYAFILNGPRGGKFTGDIQIFNPDPARPTLYLEHNVIVTGGNGSKENPYTIGEPQLSLSETILAKVSDSDYTSSQDGSIYKIKQETVIYNSTNYDAGVRYAGKDPDNYVTFNGETAAWRIIGVFEGSTIGLEPGKQYVEILKDDSIGAYSWDSDNFESDWVNSTLYSYLNNTYLDSLSDSSKIAKYNSKYSTWYLRSSGSFTGPVISEYYISERAVGSAGYRDGVANNADIETNAAIGLMYPSDYFFTGYGSNCDPNNFSDYSSTCGLVSWIYKTEWSSSMLREWLISPSGSTVFHLRHEASAAYPMDNDIDYSYEVRPTLYLEANLTATGLGSKLDPYVLTN